MSISRAERDGTERHREASPLYSSLPDAVLHRNRLSDQILLHSGLILDLSYFVTSHEQWAGATLDAQAGHAIDTASLIRRLQTRK